MSSAEVIPYGQPGGDRPSNIHRWLSSELEALDRGRRDTLRAGERLYSTMLGKIEASLERIRMGAEQADFLIDDRVWELLQTDELDYKSLENSGFDPNVILNLIAHELSLLRQAHVLNQVLKRIRQRMDHMKPRD